MRYIKAAVGQFRYRCRLSGPNQMNDYSDFEPTYTPRRKDNGRWCVVLIRPDGSEREIGDFSSDSEAWDWINTNAGKQIGYKARHAGTFPANPPLPNDHTNESTSGVWSRQSGFSIGLESFLRRRSLPSFQFNSRPHSPLNDLWGQKSGQNRILSEGQKCGNSLLCNGLAVTAKSWRRE